MPDLSSTGGSEVEFVKDLVKRQCKPWEPQSHRLVDRYFAVLETLMGEHAGELNERLVDFAGLYDATQWLFSAPRPFPRAHIFAPAGPLPSRRASRAARLA